MIDEKFRFGEVFTTTEGETVKIIKNLGGSKYDVEYKDGFTKYGVLYTALRKGYVKKEKVNRLGEKFITNQGYTVEVIKYYSARKILVQFECGYEIITSIGNLQMGKLHNPYHKSVFGVGYFGVGNYVYNSKNNTPIYKKIYTLWGDMIGRGYDIKLKEKNPTYKYVTVYENWHCFQNFGDWYEENWKPHMEGWELDKDILIKGNKIYSPETCCFVPQEVNKLFITRKNCRGEYPIGVSYHKATKKYKATICKGNNIKYIGLYRSIEEAFNAYKIAKEAYIKEVADKWKNEIDTRVYEAMYKYNVEITD